MDPYMLNEDRELEIFEIMSFDEGHVNEDIILKRSLFFNTLISIFLLFFGTVISSMIVSYNMFNVPTIGMESDTYEDDDEDEDIPYEYKYVTEFEELIHSDVPLWNEHEKTYLSKFNIMDTTPNGDVLMSYEHDKDDDERSKFVYYSDSKTIPYKYLDAVARKFVCAHKCPNIYVFIKDEIIKEMKRIEEKNNRGEEIDKPEEQSVHKNQNSVFASLKNYKTTKTSSVKKRHILITKNKYKHLGTIEDYNKSLFQKEETKDVKPISFSEFKKINACS